VDAAAAPTVSGDVVDVLPVSCVEPTPFVSVLTTSGPTRLMISHVLAMLRVNSASSPDRMVRIAQAMKQKLQLQDLTDKLNDDMMIFVGMTCAVRFEEQYYYGKVERIGSITKSKAVIETTDPVSLFSRKEGLYVWCRWLELVADSVRNLNEIAEEPAADVPVYCFGKYDDQPGISNSCAVIFDGSVLE